MFVSETLGTSAAHLLVGVVLYFISRKRFAVGLIGILAMAATGAIAGSTDGEEWLARTLLAALIATLVLVWINASSSKKEKSK